MVGFWVWSVVRQTMLFDLHKIPSPPGWPLLGNLADAIGPAALRAHQLGAAYANKYGLIYKVHIGPTACLVVTDPEEVAKLISSSNRTANLPKLAEAYRILEARAPHFSLFGTPDPQEWKSFRKTLNPAFSPENIRKATRAQLDWIALTSSSLWEALLYALLPFLPAAKEAKASISFVRQPNPFMRVSILLVQDRRDRHGVARSCWKKPLWEKEDELAHAFRKRGEQPLDDTSLWACFSRLVNYKDSLPVSHDTLATNIGFFFTAGYETTAHLINWALFELAANPDVQTRLRQELDSAGLMPTALQPEPRQLEFADLTKLAWLDSVVKETLRLHATAPNGTFRKVDKDMIIGGYRIPKGTPVQLPVYPMHLSPHNYVQPCKFWPERWMQQSESVAKDSEYPDATPTGNRRCQAASWNPFSCGPRNCIGQSLALAEARTTLAVFVAKFHFALPEGVDRETFLKTEQVSRLTLQPKGTLLLNTTPVSVTED
ncbi:MAG: cytochrome P450 [Trebouxia sp. A1-2]|nr:MAG: cytochrome P450 [Trebouxia sp. A1-2]